MEDTAAPRPRRGPQSHYTVVSNAVIFGYHDLDDSAKLTYQAIDSFDWPNQAGERKGYAYPSVPTLARLRGVSERTIQRHLDALEAAGLLRREMQPGKPCRLWLEDPSAEEGEKYLSTIGASGDADDTRGGDTAVTPYKKEEREEDKPVNESQRLWEEKRRVRLTELERAKREWLANHMVEQLGDPHSLGFYRKVASAEEHTVIFETLSKVREARHEGRLKTTAARLFTHQIKRPRRSSCAAASSGSPVLFRDDSRNP